MVGAVCAEVRGISWLGILGSVTGFGSCFGYCCMEEGLSIPGNAAATRGHAILFDRCGSMLIQYRSQMEKLLVGPVQHIMICGPHQLEMPWIGLQLPTLSKLVFVGFSITC